MGDILPPKRQTVVDRLRRRIEHYRRHQGACVPRYEQTLDGLLGQHAQDTFLLRQRFLESKAKKSTKKSAANADHTPKTPTSNAASLQSSKYKRAHVDRLGSPITPAKISVTDEDLATQQPSHPAPARTPQQQQQQPTAIPMDQSPSAGNPSGLTQLSVEIVQQFSSSSGPQIQTNVTVTTMAGSGLKTSIGSPASSVGQDIKNHPTSNERDLQDKMTNGTGAGVSCKQEPEQGGMEECGRATEMSDGFEATMNGTGSFVDPVPFISQFVLMEDSSDGIINSDAFNDLMANLSPDLITEFEDFGDNVDAVAATIKPHDTEDGNGHKDLSSEGQKISDGTGSRDSSALEDPSGLLSASVVLQCSNGGYQVAGGKQVSPLNFCGPQNPVQVPRRLPAAETLMHMAEQHQNMKQKQHQQHHHHQQQTQQQQLQHQPQQQQPQQNSHLGMGLHARTPYGTQAAPSASEYHSMPEALPQFRAAAATAMDFVNAASSNQSFMGKGSTVSAAGGGGTHSASMFPFVSQAQQQQHHHHHHHHHHQQQQQQPQHHHQQQHQHSHHHQQHQHHHHRHHVQQQVTFTGSLGTQGSAGGSPTPQNAPQPFGAVKASFGGSGADCSSPVAVHVHSSSSSPGAQYIHSSASATGQNQIHHQQQQHHQQLHQQHYMNSHQLQVSQMQQQAAQSGQQQLQTSQGQQMRIGDGGKMVAKTNQTSQLQQQQQQLQQRNAAFNQQHQTPVSSTDHYHMAVGRSQSAIFGQPQPTAIRMTSGNGGNVPMHFTAKMEPTVGGHDTMQQAALRQQMYHHHQQQQQQQQQQQRQPSQICTLPRPPPPQYMVQHQMATQQQQEQTMVAGFPMTTSTPGGRPPTQTQLPVVVSGRGAKSANSYTRDQRAPNVVLSHGGHEWRPMHSQARFVGPTSLVNVADGSACAVQGQLSSQQHQRLFPVGNVSVHGRIRPSRMPVATNADMNHNVSHANMMQSVPATLQNATGQMANSLQMVPSLQMNVMSDLLDGSADGFLPSGGTDFNLDFLDSMVTGGNGGGSSGANGGTGGAGGATFNASDANDLLCSLDSGTAYSILEGL